MLLTSLFRAATIENPRYSLNDPNAFDELGATRSVSGMPVNVRTALTLPAYWRGVNLLAGYLAKVPIFIYKRTEGGKERAKDHQGYNLVRWKINEYTKASTWKQTIQGHALTKGNGYTYIVRDGLAAPKEGLILDPEATYPVRENGKLWYVTKIKRSADDIGELRKLRPDDVHHIHGLGYDGTQGYDVITYAKEALGKAQAQQKYASIFFKNNGKPSMVLMHPATLKKEAREELRASWERMNAGLDNAHRTAVLDGGLQPKELSATSRDNQIIEQEKFSLVDIANILGLPVHKVGGEGRTAYASLEQENQALLDDTLDPWLVQWEEETRDKFLTEQEKESDSHSVQCLRNSLISVNAVDKANYFRAALGGRPWMIPDEVRELEDMNDLGGEAAVYLNPLNMGQGGADNEPKPKGPSKSDKTDVPKDDADDNADAKAVAERVRQQGIESQRQMDEIAAALRENERAKACHALLADAVHRLTKRIATSAEKAAKDPDAFVAWVDAIEADHGETIRKALDPIGALQGRESQASEFIAAVREAYSSLADRATAKTLAAEVETLNAELESKYARP